MVIIGGAGSFWGVVIAGVLMAALPEVLRFSEDSRRMIIYAPCSRRCWQCLTALPAGCARGAWSACERRCDEARTSKFIV